MHVFPKYFLDIYQFQIEGDVLALRFFLFKPAACFPTEASASALPRQRLVQSK